jgi:hypothetical protein
MQAIWQGTVVAESDQTVVVEGNHYFPPTALRTEYFEPSSTHYADVPIMPTCVGNSACGMVAATKGSA